MVSAQLNSICPPCHLVGEFILIQHQLKVYEGELVCGAASWSSALLIVILAWIRLHGSG